MQPTLDLVASYKAATRKSRTVKDSWLVTNFCICTKLRKLGIKVFFEDDGISWLVLRVECIRLFEII